MVSRNYWNLLVFIATLNYFDFIAASDLLVLFWWFSFEDAGEVMKTLFSEILRYKNFIPWYSFPGRSIQLLGNNEPFYHLWTQPI